MKTFRTVDFRPAAVPGWRVYKLRDDFRVEVEPLAGWLIRDEVIGGDPTGDRDVTPVVMTGDGLLIPIEELKDFWYVAGPGDPEPTQEDVEEERAAAARHGERGRA